MDHGLIDRVAGLVREDAGRKTGHNLVTLVIRSHGKHTSKDGKSGSNRGKKDMRRRRGFGSKGSDFLTLYSKAHLRMLSLISTFFLKKSTLYFMFLKRPPTMAAR